VLALNVLFFGTLGLGAWLAALVFVLGGGGDAPPHVAIVWLSVVPLVFLVALVYRAPSQGIPLGRTVGPWVDRVLAGIGDAMSIVRRLLASPRQNRGALAGTLLYWLGDAACLWAGLRAFNVDVTGPALIVGYATGYLFTLLPLPLGGIGAVDAAMAVALRGVGVPLAPALLGVLAYRFFSFWLPTLPGLVAISTLPALGRRLGRSAGSEQVTEPRPKPAFRETRRRRGP
jgi:Mg2+-importing ATPase